MSSALELVLLVLAALAVLALGVDFMRRRLRERTEKELLDRLAAEAPTVVVASAEPGLIEKRLRAAGLRGPSEAYVFAASVLAVSAFVIVLRTLPALPAAAVITFCLALYLPWAGVTAWAKHRSLRFEALLTEAIDLMVASLYAGGNLNQAFRSAGAVADQPIRGEFDEVDRRLGLGLPLNRAFGRMIEGFDGEGVRLFAQTLMAKSQAGGDLAPVLRSLNETLRDRARQQRQVQAQLSGVRLSAIAISVLPYLFAPLLAWMRPDWFRPLFAHPLGAPMMVFALMLQLIGILWIWRVLSREL